MDCVETAVLRKAGLQREMVMYSSSSTAAAAALSGHWQCQQSSPCFPYPAPAEEDFSVDDLLDLGDGKELSSDMEDFLEVEEEEEEEEGKESPIDLDASSVLSFQAPPPSEPIVPVRPITSSSSSSLSNFSSRKQKRENPES